MGKEMFVDENSKEEFKSLCMEVAPLINGIMSAVKNRGIGAMTSLSMGEDGYFKFDIHGSRWSMARMGDGEETTIRYGFRERINVPDIEKSGKAVFGHLTENIMEITLVFADMQLTHPDTAMYDSTEWKQKFVEWANEFEDQWTEDDDRDYPEEIDKFARDKIIKYLGEGE